MEMVHSIRPGRCECMRCCYRRAIAGGFTPMFVVYDRPPDCPEHVVVRLWHAARPTSFGWTFKHVDDARDAIPRGLTCVPRHAQDDKKIVESWL